MSFEVDRIRHAAGQTALGLYGTEGRAYDRAVNDVKVVGMYDLHTHSLFSDGTTTPRSIVAEAASLGLRGVALTDHDTVDGWDEARAAAEQHGIDFVPGLEVTTKYQGFSTHLLAYGIDPNNSELAAELVRVRQSRVNRAEEMVNRLSEDFDVNWADIRGGLGDTVTVGRPHIADALVQRGHFEDRGQVFAEVLHPGSHYYVRTYAIETIDAIGLINGAGGVAVLAHPAALRQRRPAPPEVLTLFHAAGLWGVELDHPENREEWLPPLRECARDLGLEITGSSDYHGEGKANRLAERTSPTEIVDRMRERIVTPR